MPRDKTYPLHMARRKSAEVEAWLQGTIRNTIGFENAQNSMSTVKVWGINERLCGGKLCGERWVWCWFCWR